MAVSLPLTLFVLGLFTTSSASAATYSVYACEGPSGQALPNSAWLTSVENSPQTPLFSFGSVCGDLSVSASTTDAFESGDGGEYVFDPPTGTTIAAYRLTRSVDLDFADSSGNSAVSAGLRESNGSTVVDRDCSAVVTDCVVPEAIVQRTGISLTRLALGTYCIGSPSSCPANRLTNFSSTFVSARVDLEDSTIPQIVAIGGTLPGSTAIAGTQSLDVTATDVGGGVARVELTIDGGSARTVSAGGSCGTPYTLRQPCPSGGLAPFSVDTGEFINGLHLGSVRAIDAAGNVSSIENFLFTVTAGGRDQGSLNPVNGSPAVERPMVRADRSVISSARGKSVTVEGTLTTETGTPISGAQLEVTSVDLGVFNAPERSLGSITTTAAGRFSVKVSPRGAQRVSVVFRPTPISLGTAVTTAIVREELDLSVKRSRARVKPRGLLTLTGRLAGAGAAADGAPVEIDVKIGNRWRAVDVTDTSASGAYKWRYRFTRVTKPTRFTFRAVVRANKSWPWKTKVSKSVNVLVAP